MSSVSGCFTGRVRRIETNRTFPSSVHQGKYIVCRQTGVTFFSVVCFETSPGVLFLLLQTNTTNDHVSLTFRGVLSVSVPFQRTGTSKSHFYIFLEISRRGNNKGKKCLLTFRSCSSS